MKPALVLVLVALLLASIFPIAASAPEKRSLDISSLTITFDKTDAIFTVNYDFDRLPKMYLLLFGSKNLEPKIRSMFANFDYEIKKIDQDQAILRVKNFSRFEKGYYLHDSRIKFGEGIRTIYIYTSDSTEPKKYSGMYIFNWHSVPGSESNKLLGFLKDDLGLDWVEDAKITKNEDDKTIYIFTDEKSAEIVLEGTDRAVLQTSDGQAYELLVKQVKEENEPPKIYLYSTLIYSTPNIYYRS
ncbi:MAG: hypothetical protein FIB08_11400 [Candidatus Methanoperedens sp.]|nr:hypothetical protein [Candidatus Methanoperedens sp.]